VKRTKPAPGKLSRQSVLLLVVNGMFAAANALSGTFVNVYLWKAKKDFALIGWFAFANQLAMAVTFWLAGKWVKEHNKMNSLRLGIALSALFYLLVLWLGRRAADFAIVLGAVQGMSAGFFWLAFNVVYFEVTGPDDRDRFNGWAGLLGSTSGMVAPWLSGLLISRMEDAKGYRLIFTLSLAVFLACAIVSFFLKKRKRDGRYEWLHSIRKLRSQETPWRLIVPSLTAQGMREGVFGFAIGLLVYIATASEMKLGNYFLITSAVGMISFWTAGRLLKSKNRGPAMLLGVLAMTLVILPFFWKINYATLLVFGIGSALFFPFFSIPMTSTVFDIIGRSDESVAHREEYVVLRETALNIGRMAGTLLFIAVVSFTVKPLPVTALLLLVGAAPLLTWHWIRKIDGYRAGRRIREP